jgi:hypothetical protein
VNEDPETQYVARVLWENGYTAGQQSRQQEIDDLKAALFCFQQEHDDLAAVPQPRQPDQ